MYLYTYKYMYVYVHLNMKNNLTPDKSILQQIESGRRVGRKKTRDPLRHFDASTGNPMRSQKKNKYPRSMCKSMIANQKVQHWDQLISATRI